MFCSKCGNKALDTAMFCNKCGSAFRNQPVRPKNLSTKTVHKIIFVIIILVLTCGTALWAFTGNGRNNNDYYHMEYEDSNFRELDTSNPDAIPEYDLLDSTHITLDFTTMTISAGLLHNLVIDTDGNVWAWGNNNHGQIGDGSTINRHSPVQIMDGVIAVAAGYRHSLALTHDGVLWAWGSNTYGQLGDGTTIDRARPVQIMDDVLSFTAGRINSFAITNDGVLWVWGDNRSGQVGDGTRTNRYRPTQIMENVIFKTSGDTNNTFAITRDNVLWAWGWNGRGQLGDGTTVSRLYPTRIMDDVAYVTTFNLINTYAITNDGSLWVWGWSIHNPTSYPRINPPERLRPARIKEDVVSISAGGQAHNLVVALTNDGSLWSWEWIFRTNMSYIRFEQITPTLLLSNVVSISSGWSHTLAITDDGVLWGWGLASLVEHGSQSHYTILRPERVLDNVHIAVASHVHSFAVTYDGRLWAWGQNPYGVIGDGTRSRRQRPVPILDNIRVFTPTTSY